MTPYAVLLVRPLDEDYTVRHAFHQLSKQHHPDHPGANGAPGLLWYALVAAYQAVRDHRGVAKSKRSLFSQYPTFPIVCDEAICSGDRLLQDVRSGPRLACHDKMTGHVHNQH